MKSETRGRVLILFGTRPEIIKLAPVIHELSNRKIATTVVSSNQHRQLLKPLFRTLNVKVDFNLDVMQENQSLNGLSSRILAGIDPILASEKPDMILVQGDTTTTLAGAIAGFNRQIPVGHVEAGLRSGNLLSPFPEEMNRRLVSQVSTFHFAATSANQRSLMAESVPEEQIFVTGNTIVDSINKIAKTTKPSQRIQRLIESTTKKKRILLTTHRRESFGYTLRENLTILKDFVERHPDICVFFPVHPNPNVRDATAEIFGKNDRIHLLEPVGYADFVSLMKAAWLIVSDSGGVQEEAPSLGKAVLVLRENTERQEAIKSGHAKLVGAKKGNFKRLLEESYQVSSWTNSVRKIKNPFGDGKAAKRIVGIIEKELTHRLNGANSR